MQQKTKQLIMTLVALLAVTGAWADETPLVTIESKNFISFTGGSKTFDDKVTVTFSNLVDNDGDEWGWYTYTSSLLTVAGTNGYTITSCKFYTEYGTAKTGYTIEGESPSVYLNNKEVFTDNSKSVNIGYNGVTKIEVYGTPPTPVTFTRGTGDKANEWTMDGGMPAGNVRVNVEYWPGMLTLPAASEGGTVTLEGETNTIIDENFDDYTAGGKMAQTANAAGNSNWTTWTNWPGGDEDGTLATLDDNTCLKVTTYNDQVLLLGDRTSGMWEFSLDVYVPEGKFGYFNLLHDFAGESSRWALQCYLNAYDDGQNHYYSLGHGTVHAGSSGTADLPCVHNEWMHVRIVIDIDNDLAKLYFNGEFICEWQWSLDSFGENLVGGKLAACNIYCDSGEFYVDNIKLTQISALPAGFETDDDGNIYVESGTQFTLVTTPAENYHLASLSDGTNTYDVDDDGKVTITMPAADLTLTAEFAENTYDLTLNPANVNTIEAGMATVTVDDQPATVTDGKIEDVKMGSEVTMTTTTGYKFRKVSSQAYGICVYNVGESWPLGFITFNIDDPSNVSVLNVFNGIAYDYFGLDYCPADGYYYAYDYYNKQLLKMDLNGNIVGTVATTFDTDLTDGAWNPINNTMYASYDYSLYTINLSTGELTTLVTSEKEFRGIACNADGQLYVTMSDGNLYTVNATTGELTLVGATGYNPNYAQSLQFDKLTGNLYWCYSDDDYDHFMQVDPTTGAATVLQANTGETTGLSFPLSLVKFSDTEAKFTMPASDATFNYDIVRDMEIAVNAVMPANIRLQEKQGGGYEPIDATKMIPEVKDAIDGESQAVTMTEVTEQTAETGDYTLKLQMLGDEETWVDADPDNLSVGTYRYEVTGANLYGGVCYTNEFKLFEGYPVTVPAHGFVTYYSDENLTVEDNSAAQLYTITAVSGNNATATPIASANEGMPFLIYNPTDVEQTFILIPTENEIDLSVYPGFKGTLVDKTFTAADMARADFYVVNNAQFVWVKDPGTIAANRCWLEKAKNSAARSIAILFGDATGITAVSGSAADNGDIYDLNGRKVQRPVKKGVYIQNGQKKIVK